MDILGTPEHLIFHGELFELTNSDGSTTFALCEIAARRPGGSIGLLIEEAEGGKGLFPEMEFRLNIGLPLRHNRERIAQITRENFTVADLMVPKQLGKLVSIPEVSTCTLPNIIYKPLAKVGTVYKGFDVNTMNTAARFIATVQPGENLSAKLMEARLNAALAWFNKNVVYAPDERDLQGVFNTTSSLKKLTLDSGAAVSLPVSVIK